MKKETDLIKSIARLSSSVPNVNIEAESSASVGISILAQFV